MSEAQGDGREVVRTGPFAGPHTSVVVPPGTGLGFGPTRVGCAAALWWSALGSLAAGLFTVGGCTVHLYDRFVRMESKVDQIDDRLKFTVGEATKGPMADLEKKVQEYDHHIKCETFAVEFREQVCRGEFEAAVASYDAFMKRIEPKDLPDSIKARVTPHLIEAAGRTGRGSHFSEAVLDRLEAGLRRPPTPCDGLAFYYLGVLNASAGRLDRARGILRTAIELLADSRSTPPDPVNLGAAYAAVLLTDLGQRRDVPAKERAGQTWKVLSNLENTVILPTAYIRGAMAFAENKRLIAVLSDRDLTGMYGDAVRELEARLRAKTFIPSPEDPSKAKEVDDVPVAFGAGVYGGTPGAGVPLGAETLPGPGSVQTMPPNVPAPKIGGSEGKGKPFELDRSPPKASPPKGPC